MEAVFPLFPPSDASFDVSQSVTDEANSIAAAFTSVVTSFVADIMLPPISLLPFMNKNLDEKFAVLRRGPTYNTTDGLGYNTLQEAADDGAVVMAYG